MQNKQIKRTAGAVMAAVLAAGQILCAVPVYAENNAAEYCYGTMNIPYADYYYGELGNPTNTTNGNISADADLAGEAGLREEGVYDAVTSATSNKWKNMFAGSSYSSEPDEKGGGQILGVVSVPVAIDMELYKALEAETESGEQHSGTLMKLFAEFKPNEDQSVVPTAYKELFADGTLSATIAEKTVSAAEVKLNTNSSYGDYQLSVSGLELGEDVLYGVVVTTDSGRYAMLHLENIWRNGSEISWSAGVKTTEVHGNTLRSLPYTETSGAELTGITYLTNNGVYQVDIADAIYLPKKTSISASAESSAADSGKIALTVENVPDDFKAEISVNGLEDVSYADGVLTYNSAKALPGQYQIKISDSTGVYADVLTNVLLTTDEIPAVFDAESNSLKAAEGTDEAAFANYLKNLSKVTVNETSYNLSGKRSVKLINTETGAIDTSVKSGEEDVFAESGVYKLSLTATGCTTPLEFEITVEKPAAAELRGDVNADGKIDISDATAVLEYYAKKAAEIDFVLNEDSAVNEILMKNADVNNDGEINIEDATDILKYYAKNAAGMKPEW